MILINCYYNETDESRTVERQSKILGKKNAKKEIKYVEHVLV